MFEILRISEDSLVFDTSKLGETQDAEKFKFGLFPGVLVRVLPVAPSQNDPKQARGSLWCSTFVMVRTVLEQNTCTNIYISEGL